MHRSRRYAAALAAALAAVTLASTGPLAAAAQGTWSGAYGEWAPSVPGESRYYRIDDATVKRLQDCVNANYLLVGRDRVVDYCIPRIRYSYTYTVTR